MLTLTGFGRIHCEAAKSSKIVGSGCGVQSIRLIWYHYGSELTTYHKVLYHCAPLGHNIQGFRFLFSRKVA